MHCLALGVRRTLNKFTVYLLGDDLRLGPGMKLQNRNMILFKITERVVLSTFNAFLEICSSKAPEYGLKVDFFQAGDSDYLTRLFNENGLHGILESFDFDAFHNVSTFFGAIVGAL